ncbi:natural killer cells antigen CD94 [Oryctolagus cuniculus]|uniref:natural killer cells antigen CD94 n=1 Tax=Oryctolagus cuniculus TaxID=9986 RepID=UPI0038798D32
MTEEKVTYPELKLCQAKKKEGKRHLAHKKRVSKWPGVLGWGGFCFEETACGSLQGRPFCWTRNWYYFSKEEVTWDESRNLCQNMGSSLVKIDDIQELIFMQSQIKYTYWIGLYKKGDKHEWMWQDSTKLAQNL